MAAEGGEVALSGAMVAWAAVRAVTEVVWARLTEADEVVPTVGGGLATAGVGWALVMWAVAVRVEVLVARMEVVRALAEVARALATEGGATEGLLQVAEA